MTSKKLQIVELKDINMEETKDNNTRGSRGNKNSSSTNKYTIGRST